MKKFGKSLDSYLSVRQRRFVELYTGDGVAAVRGAGYKCKSDSSASKMAHRLLCNPKIKYALEKRIEKENEARALNAKALAEYKHLEEKTEKLRKRIKQMKKEILLGHIATKKERQAFWTKIMMNFRKNTKDRLRASELLAKAQGDFVERTEIEVKDDGVQNPIIDLFLKRITIGAEETPVYEPKPKKLSKREALEQEMTPEKLNEWAENFVKGKTSTQ